MQNSTGQEKGMKRKVNEEEGMKGRKGERRVGEVVRRGRRISRSGSF